MVELSRTIRFCLAVEDGALRGRETPRDNTFAAWPAMQGLSRYYELHLTCRGEPNPATGYFINIKQMDEAMREHVLPRFAAALAEDDADGVNVALGALLKESLLAADAALDRTAIRLALQLTPFLALSIEKDDMAHLTIRHQYEFSAAHRLHVPEFDDAENQRIFGKCNNPAGHGHNYQLEVAVRLPIDEQGHVPPVSDLDAIVDKHCIERLDHKHLNVDVPEFADLNPSVEHIARIIHGMLKEPVRSIVTKGDASLEEVKVWETTKTACVYRG